MNLKNEFSENKLTWLGKLYIWSVVFEPLLWFVVQSGNTFIGIGGNWSRILQILVISSILIRFLVKQSIYNINPFSSLYRGYTYFFLFAILSAIYGYFSGAYMAEEYHAGEGFSSIANLLLSNQVRPIIEFFIAIYYFLYFVVLPRYLLFSSDGINYFFKVFFGMFYLTYLVGMIDLLLIKLYGIEGLSRHIGEAKYPGDRFHGLAGEPREAFVYLVLGLTMLMLKNIWKNKRKLSKIKVALIIIAALFTQSASGIFGIFFAVILLIIFYFPKISLMKVIGSTIAIALISSVIFLAAQNSYRIMLYVNAFGVLYETLEAGEKVDSVLFVVMNNIYPVWERWRQVMEFNFTPLIVGTGFGSASAINNYYLDVNEYMNPNSSIVRIIYGNGLIGLFLFIRAFLVPIKKLTIDNKHKNKLILCMLLLLGGFLGHRTVCPYIFLGIALVVLQKIRIYGNLGFRNVYC